jgi:hypothetical protein
MRSASRETTPTLSQPRLPPLRHGDRMKQPEFHRRYQQYPDDVKIELVGGIIYVASPERRAHGRYQSLLDGAVCIYEEATLGVELLVNPTTILGEDSEPQPDLALRILAAFLGQSRETKDDYVEGPPELMMEISHSTRALICVKKRTPTRGRRSVNTWSWASLNKNCTGSISEPENLSCRPGRASTGRRFFFPGLWIDGPALFAEDRRRLNLVMRQGIRSRAHAAFVKKLQAAKRS